MFVIEVPEKESFNNKTQEFIQIPAATLVLEHSLISLSKWESKWAIPMISSKNLTPEQNRDYVRCMTVNKNVPKSVYDALTNEELSKIFAYIDAPVTATTFSDSGGRNQEVITSELIYYYMISFGIPFSCEKWHLTRLLTLIRICSIKNGPKKKMSRSEIAQRNRELNAQRLAKYNTRG